MKPIRHRYLADRILIMLLYRPEDPEGNILRNGSWVQVRASWLARQLKMGSGKLYQYLLHLQALGLVSISRDCDWGFVRLKVKPPLTEEPAHVTSP